MFSDPTASAVGRMSWLTGAGVANLMQFSMFLVVALRLSPYQWWCGVSKKLSGRFIWVEPWMSPCLLRARLGLAWCAAVALTALIAWLAVNRPSFMALNSKKDS